MNLYLFNFGRLMSSIVTNLCDYRAHDATPRVILRAKPEVEPRGGVHSTGSTRGMDKAVRDPDTTCRTPC